MSPELLLALLLFMVSDSGRRGYKELLEQFWMQARAAGLDLPQENPVSAAAFCKARYKIPLEALCDLLRLMFTKIQSDFESDFRWKGRRIFAIDGVRLNFKRSEDLFDAFGTPNKGNNPQALACVLYELGVAVPVAVDIAQCASSERAMLVSLLDELEPGDVVVLDRGYISFEVVQEMERRGLDYLLRVPNAHSFPTITKAQRDMMVDYPPPKDAVGLKGVAPHRVRAICDKRDEQKSFYITSLGERDFSRKEILDLYRKRWGIEEFYKTAQSEYFGQGQFRSLGRDGVKQEIVLVLLDAAIARYLMVEAAESQCVNYDELSIKTGLLTFADLILNLFLGSPHRRTAELIDDALRRIARSRVPPRPGRSYPRRSFKVQPRWGPAGRRGGG